MSGILTGVAAAEGHIRDRLERELRHFHGVKYAYLQLNKQHAEKWFLTSNYPEPWLEIYRKHNYPACDPVVQAGRSQVAPFSWQETSVTAQAPHYEHIFSQSQRYGILHGCTFILHDHTGHVALLSLSTPADNHHSVRQLLHHHRQRLQMLLIDTHSTAVNALAVPPPPGIALSPRENEILYWASMGKTYQEIAQILGIKTGTVKFHIGNAVRKFGVLNAKHAIRLGIEQRLIAPPQSVSQ
ncbi:helix-turn-helix transcriptional regulator [Serratia rubidaea]|uniref:LuxR family transcriptional regulator n=1 Tax=Serratia rubidaea TaxID=61652 RepID=A0A448S8R6_SERRU|nr:LuxR family transcriptional regulator [Serratia rubidaea]MBH1931556.1 LuxR family transcriptional regulator [Serratia rubidaea]MDC6116907.1 LuxR family transcriptional regulator [Serratia rubidaea]MEB7587554.1 LuxR family transcriptional regulator [Serratia rubidaea]VEI64086.1 Transcriptional activator protein lasR [Serratia rubidaea]